MEPDPEAGRQYGGFGVALLCALAEYGRPTFTVTEAREVARAIGIADSYLSVLLYRLQQGRLVRRLKLGTYALTTGLPGFPEAHPFALGPNQALPEPNSLAERPERRALIPRWCTRAGGHAALARIVVGGYKISVASMFCDQAASAAG